MSDSDSLHDDTTDLAKASAQPQAVVDAVQTSGRQYDRSGLYPKDGEPFRLWMLLGWNIAIIVVIAIAAALLNIWLLPAGAA
jgi:hypothetical protein